MYDTILVAILCILSNFNTCFSLWGNHITSAYSSFGLIIVVISLIIISLSSFCYLQSCVACNRVGGGGGDQRGESGEEEERECKVDRRGSESGHGKETCIKKH